jgi:hypothetical protein
MTNPKKGSLEVLPIIVSSIGRTVSCSSPGTAVDPDERVDPKRGMVALVKAIGVAAAAGVVGVPAPVDPDARVGPKRDMVALGHLIEGAVVVTVAAVAARVVGMAATAGVRMEDND